jgi:HSP20 family protein
MSLIPWSSRDISPARRIRQLQDEFVDLFKGFPGWPTAGSESTSWFPAINVKDNEKHVVVTAELPGVDKSDVHIDVTGDTLTIRGDKKEERSDRGESWWRRESSYGSFMRRIALPAEVDSGNTEAKMTNGMLEIRMPKVTGTKTKSIKIE